MELFVIPIFFRSGCQAGSEKSIYLRIGNSKELGANIYSYAVYFVYTGDDLGPFRESIWKPKSLNKSMWICTVFREGPWGLLGSLGHGRASAQDARAPHRQHIPPTTFHRDTPTRHPPKTPAKAMFGGRLANQHGFQCICNVLVFRTIFACCIY